MGYIRERKLKNGMIRFQGEIYLKGSPRLTATFDRKTDAKTWVQKVESDIRCGRQHLYSVGKKHTFQEAVDRYLKEQAVSVVKRGHLLWWKNELGCFYLQDIRSSTISEKKQKLLSERNARGVVRGKSTCNRFLATLSHLMNIATKQWEWIADNPVKKISREKEPRERTRFLTQEERLFGSQVKRLDKSTAHATAQSIGGTGKAAIFDEFEKNRHLSDVLELLKLCNRGGRKTSGTTTEKANEYTLHHLPWLASIYLPKTFSSDQAQLSRVVKFELKRVPEGKFIIGLPDNEAQDMLSEIIAALIQTWSQIEDAVSKIEHNKEQYIKDYDGLIDGRCVENLMYAMALLSLADNKERKIPAWAINEVKDDGENVLESIITSKIRYGQEEYIVIDLINLILGEQVLIDIASPTAKELLRKNGLSVVQKKTSGWILAIQCKDVSESLFKLHSDY